jgi:hypothetical protein
MKNCSAVLVLLHAKENGTDGHGKVLEVFDANAARIKDMSNFRQILIKSKYVTSQILNLFNSRETNLPLLLIRTQYL